MAATVTFKITGGEVIPEIEMLASATILDLKKRIEFVLDVGVSRQTLRFNNQVLMNEQKIERYNFGEFATLVLVVSPLEGNRRFVICVKSSIKKCNVLVKETTLVADVKKQIGKCWHVTSKNMTFYRLATKMEDDLPLSAFFVCEGSEIEVTFNLNIN